MLRSKLIYISSDHRESKQQPTTDFSIDLGSNSELHAVKRITLKSVNFLNSMYNIRNQINQLDWNHGGSDYSCFIPEGFYNTTNLATEMKTQMELIMVGITVTITQNQITGRYSFSWSAGTGYIKSDCTIAPVIGASQDALAANPYILDSFPKLNGLTHCFLRTNLAPSNMHYAGRLDNILTDIPIEVGFLMQANYEPRDIELSSLNYQEPRDIRKITINLMHENDQVVDLRGAEVEMVLKVYF